MNLFINLAVILVAFAATLGLTIAVRRRLVRGNLLDIPNERSSHTQPVPRGGGLALIAVLVPGMIIAGLLRHNLGAHMPLIIGTLVLAIVSWLDDRKGVSVRARLSLHIFAVCLGSMLLPANALLFGGAVPFWLDRLVLIVGWVWFVNLYNFMDGIDGIAGAETIALAIGACLVMTAAQITAPFASSLVLLLTGACLGFLALNWHPAKIFLGDVGSVPLGYLTGFLLIVLAVHGHLIPALILPLYYLADSDITLIRRALRGEKIWQAHRQHFYQRAAAAGIGRHDKVVLWIIAADIALIGAALIAVIHPWPGAALAVLAVAILLGKMHKTGLTQG